MGKSSSSAPPFVRLAAHPLRWELLSALAHSDLRVRDLVGVLGQPQNLISYHLRLLRDGGLVTARRSSFDGRDSYYHLDLDECGRALAGTGAALHPALRVDSAAPAYPQQPRGRAVLFVCTGNSARSPIAEAQLRHHTGGRVEVVSAGSRPQARLHSHAVRVLRDGLGVDVAGWQPRHLDTVGGRRFDYVITLCDKAREVCPDLGDPGGRLHWSIAEPDDYAAFVRVAAEIDARVRHLLPVLASTGP